jgi:murein lipoprotein
MMEVRNVTRAGLLMAALAITAGCASTGDVDELRAELERANAAAERAAADAASARQDAAAARAAAEQAQAEAVKTNEKLDRMFKKSMYK